MKKILITCLFCFGFLWGNAQIIVDKKDINKDTAINTIMVRIVEGVPFSKFDFSFFLDCGQGFSKIYNNKRERLEFYSLVEAIVFFEGNGWVLQNFSVSYDNASDRDFYYLFRRKK